MLRSRLLYLPRRDGPKDAMTISHKLLSRASFFRASLGSGLWETLPLGKRVLSKLEDIVSEELSTFENCQRVEMPCLVHSENWKKTKRWESIGEEMFRLKDRKSVDLLLAPTHEESFTDMVANMYGLVPRSALPLALYQIGRKFRDELRPRAGLLRAREFIMKDLYTFDESEEAALKTYQEICKIYERIFKVRLSSPVIKAVADSGKMGGSYSHEFHFESPIGEDTVLRCDTGDFCANVEATSNSKNGDKCINEKCSCHGKGTLLEKKCIEVGHSFFLGTKYSIPLKARYLNENGKMEPLQMCSYGIGMTRVLAALVEIGNDSHGIIWPKEIAPFQVILLNVHEASATKVTEVFQALKTKFKTDILFDDTPVGFANKMYDARLLGVPYICVVGASHLELHDRSSNRMTTFPLQDLSSLLQAIGKESEFFQTVPRDHLKA